MGLAQLLVTALAAAGPAGYYEAHQMELGAALDLQADGHFRYVLDYGAVSEYAAGTWTTDKAAVALTFHPTAGAPRDRSPARFAGEKLTIDHGDLLLRRYDVTIRFRKEQP